MGKTRSCKCGSVIKEPIPKIYYCDEEYSYNCEQCSKPMTLNCRGNRKRFCSTSCQATFASRSDAAMKARKDPVKIAENLEKFKSSLEKKYGPGITNPSQINSVKAKRSASMKERLQSGEMKRAFQVKYGDSVVNPSQIPELKERNRKTQRKVQKDKDVIKRALKSKFPEWKHIDEYVSLDYTAWAIKFFDAHNRKPTLVDFQKYFNKWTTVKVPYEAKKYFDLKDSYLELYFQHCLEEIGLILNKDFFRRKRFLKASETTPALEIDFFFPEKMIGVEIQDFATHSKEHDDEPTMFKGIKKGPKYHENKRAIAQDYGIQLFDFWEDDLEHTKKDALIENISFMLFASEISPTGYDEYSAYAHEVAAYKQELLKTGEVKALPKAFDNHKPWYLKG